nr:ATP synthase F0 subunit 8 [Meloe cavensis]
MPQMAPLNWLSLMAFFISLLLLINSLNFFSFLCQHKASLSTRAAPIKTNWKWL